MSYITELIKRPVYDSSRQKIGRLRDLVATLGESSFPEVVAVEIGLNKSKKLVPWSQVAEFNEEIRLSVKADALQEYTLGAHDVFLDRDILDKQIVNVHGARIVRVNDLNLVLAHGTLRLIGVDVGIRGLLRRIGLEKTVEKIARALGLVLHGHVVSWTDVERLEETVDRLKFRVPTSRLSRLHHADIADIVAQLDPAERKEVFETLDVETAADTLEEMEPEVQVSIIEGLEPERAADIVEEMEPDDAADLMADLREETREELLEEMQPEEAADVKDLMAYHEESAGGIMTTGYVAVPHHYTAQQALDELRGKARDVEMIYYVYVEDDEGRLEGVVSLRSLIVSRPETPIREIMEPNVMTVNLATHMREVAHAITKYDLLAVPVVDEDNRMHGVVTVDDVMDLIVPPTWSDRPPRIFGKG